MKIIQIMAGSVRKNTPSIPVKKSARHIIGPEFIEEIKNRLVEGKRVRRILPMEGRLNIDRPLPFLVVYRRPGRKKDPGTDKLVIGEASYLIAPGSRSQHAGLTRLIHAIIETQVNTFGSFLLLEIWSSPINQLNPLEPNLNSPEFRIITSPTRPPSNTIETLQDSLRRIKVNRLTSTVNIVYSSDRKPHGMSPLIPFLDARRANCYLVGLQIGAMYRNQDTGKIFPLALRRLHLGLSRAFKLAAFTFARKQTTMRPKHFQALGKRALVKSVWEIDRQLAEIDSMFNFLLLVTPVNVDPAWHIFKRNKYEKIPELYYRLRPIDPALLKRRLYEIPIESIEDPVIANLLREKRMEINRKLTMLEDRNQPQFLYGSLQLYGGISAELKRLAEEILNTLSPHRRRNGIKREFVNAEQFFNRAEQEMEYYRAIYPAMQAKVEIRNDIVGLMVASGNLLLSDNVNILPSRIEALIQHEIGTHVLTYYNGKHQPFQQLYCGLPGYEELQEGLAVMAEYLVGGLNHTRLRLLAGRVVASDLLIQGSSFIESFRVLNNDYGFDKRTAYTITVRTFRGGGLTKDAVYLRGLVQLLDYLKEGGDIAPLFVGKIALEHIPVIKELQWRAVLHAAPLMPRYLKNEDILEKLSKLKNIETVIDLVH